MLEQTSLIMIFQRRNHCKSFIVACLFSAVFFAIATCYYRILEDKADDPNYNPRTTTEESLLDLEYALMKGQSSFDEIVKLRHQRLSKKCIFSGRADEDDLFNFGRLLADQLSRDVRLMPRLLVSDQHKSIFCSVNDDVSVTWERIFEKLEGGEGKNAGDIDARFSASTSPRLLWNYRPVAIDYRLKNYFKFMVVGNPLKKLLSIYEQLNSTRTGSDRDSLERLSRDIRNGSRDDVSLSRFVDYVMNDTRPRNHVLATYADLCMPCHIRYDVIGRRESAADESKYILQKMNVNNIQYPVGTAVFPADSRSNLKSGQVDRLFKKYKVDFALFGYTRD